MSHFVRKSDPNRIKVWECYHGRGIGKQQWVASGWRLRDATIKLQRRRQSGFRDGAIVLTSYESTTEVRDDVPGSERFAVDARTANSADPGTRHAVHTVLAQVATLPLRPSTASQPATRSGERARRQPRTRRAPSALRQTVNYYKSVKTWTLAIELRAHSRDTIRNRWSLNPNRLSWVVAQRPDRQELNAFIVFFFPSRLYLLFASCPRTSFCSLHGTRHRRCYDVENRRRVTPRHRGRRGRATDRVRRQPRFAHEQNAHNRPVGRGVVRRAVRPVLQMRS